MDLSEFTKKRSYSCVLSGKNLVFSYTGKSRFVLKDAVFLERLCLDVLEKYNIKNANFSFISNSTLCSKAKTYLQMKGFSINASM
ncbi:tram-like protein [Campylobacter upsaliensis]|uniref:tram-like protein n=2 Tax=Pseudomonadati TaxID=3379134 RepID=UPI0022EA9AAE|nr:tram-like protein [Campylobacter upsaliensis]MEB2787716.1 tram-like protein [Campylobacter upsaliensis]MEB2796778.1 tram-like protein [Campylobacter upsaliensis]